MTWLAIAAFLGTGAVAGVLAGLLGVGGGLVIVPALVLVFEAQGFHVAHIQHLALGTSLASIMFTSISSVRAHHQRAAVDWLTVRRMAGGLAMGTFAGSWLAARLPSYGLKWFFVVFALVVAAQMLSGYKPKPGRTLPGVAGTSAAGGVIGVISSFVGIGGGSLSVPFLTWCNVAMQRAVGTSAALGFPIAMAGFAGYAVNGLGATQLPPGSLGYIYLPALAAIVLASVLTAPLGAALAHRLPVPTLKKCFAALLILIACRMLYGLIS